MITTLTGSNSFMLQQELRRLVDTFVAEYTDLGLDKLDGEETEYDKIRESLESMPFLAQKKLVVLRTPGAQKQFTENLGKLIEGLPDNTDVIIIEPKLDKRLSYYKTLKAHTQFKEFPELDEPALARWLVETAKSRGGVMNPGDANLLIRRIGPNQQMLTNELTKLIDYSPAISKETVLLLTEQSPQSTTFELLDAALTGQAKRAVELYEEQRKQKVEPIQIIALLAWQLHALAVIKTAGDKDVAVTAREAKLNPYVLRKSNGIAKRLTLSELKDLIARVHQLDVRLKSESIDADEAMLHLLLCMSRKQ